MLAHGIRVVGDVDAVHLVAGHMAVQPLDVRRHLGQDVVRRARRGRHLVRRHRAEPGKIASMRYLGMRCSLLWAPLLTLSPSSSNVEWVTV